jgi:hypothetical protein
VADHYRIINAVRDVVMGLNLPGMADPLQHQVRKLATDRDLPKLPAVLYTPPLAERMPPGEFTEIWRLLPVLITFADADNQSLVLREDQLDWRELVLDHFERTALLAGVPEVWNRTIEPGPVIDPDLWKNAQLFRGSILIWFWIAKGR